MNCANEYWPSVNGIRKFRIATWPNVTRILIQPFSASSCFKPAINLVWNSRWFSVTIPGRANLQAIFSSSGKGSPNSTKSVALMGAKT